jgi:hypothetical protein
MGRFHPSPPLEGTAPGQEWLSEKLASELDALLNLIYLAKHNPDQSVEYLEMSEETVARIRLLVQKYRWFNAA